ncbi:MAG: WhiB family transcriptional regulator [Actinomycetota bacterium]
MEAVGASTGARLVKWSRPLCTGLTELFFSEEPDEVAQAKAICQGCALRVPCAAAAIANGEEAGVWGGMTVAELREAIGGVDRQRTPRAGRAGRGGTGTGAGVSGVRPPAA